jgi:ketosteroid isomerase-like protein
MKTMFQFLIASLWLAACSGTPSNNSVQISKAKEEILAAEAAFDAMARNKGVKEAFVSFAANDASLIRGNLVIKGKVAIEEYMNRPSPYTNVKLTWKPDFVDVSVSGDLGYTWGHYTYTALDSLGQSFESEGIFRTVWKKQTDGTWRYVVD